MKAHPLQALVRHARRLAGAAEPEPRGDADLLARFAESRDEEAFEEIVQRHGPLVWAICRTNLNPADADDAFQATFLVLARKAKSIRKAMSLTCWLSGVARRTVQNVRARQQRRREVALPNELLTESIGGVERLEESRILAEELDRLPDKYRLPMLLCYYQGLTNEGAAKRLGWPHGTVCGRLARARRILHERLTQRGIALTIGAVSAGHAGQPANLIAATLRACSAASVNSLPPSIVKLAEATMHAIWIGKVKVAVGAGFIVAGLGAGTGWIMSPVSAQVDGKGNAPAKDKPKPPTVVTAGSFQPKLPFDHTKIDEKRAEELIGKAIESAVPSMLADKKPEDDGLRMLLKERHRSAAAELRLRLQVFRAGARGGSIDDLLRSLRNAYESEIALSDKTEDRIAAAKRAVQIAEAIVAINWIRFNFGQIAGQDFEQSRFYMFDAQIKLAELELKTVR